MPFARKMRCDGRRDIAPHQGSSCRMQNDYATQRRARPHRSPTTDSRAHVAAHPGGESDKLPLQEHVALLDLFPRPSLQTNTHEATPGTDALIQNVSLRCCPLCGSNCRCIAIRAYCIAAVGCRPLGESKGD